MLDELWAEGLEGEGLEGVQGGLVGDGAHQGEAATVAEEGG